MSNEPAACQRMLEHREALSHLRVLTVGGANVEHAYSLPRPFEPDAKYSVDPQPRVAGGSSVNHACRLLAMGVRVEPILPAAKSDAMSGVIVEALEQAEATGRGRFRRTDLLVRGAGLTTPFTTIIRHAGSRAVLNEFSPAMMRAFREHVQAHLARLEGARSGGPRVMLVGHVHADRAPGPDRAVGHGGAITEHLLTHPALAGARRYVNFGRAQYELGARHWNRLLRDRVDVFQLDIGEIRRFCRDAALPDASLESILGWFRERCSVVVTLERFGAIGQLAGSDRPVAAWPFVLDDLVDSTGAGDAMGAGIVASMAIDDFEASEVDDATRLDRFEAALDFGRVCGAYACTTLGGATRCPSLEALADFESHLRSERRDRGVGREVTRHELFLIDRAFDG
jgi:sugar/nucleoside kinase (ribokinase family)